MSSVVAAAVAVEAFAGEPIEATSAVSAVTVYLDRALVTRSADVQCPAGTGEFVLKGLPSELADGSVRVRAAGAVVRGVRVERAFLERAAAAEVRALEDEIQGIRDTETALRDDLAVLAAEEEFLKGLKGSVPERTSRMLSEGALRLPDVTATQMVLELVTTGLSGNAARAREANRRLRDVAPKVEAKRRELDEKKSAGRLEEKSVTVALESAEARRVRLEVSYLLPGAMWFPAYDVRADLEKGELELVYCAVIQQATGEDWPGAELTLSASRPTERTSKPELAPWLVGGAADVAAQAQQAEVRTTADWLAQEAPQITSQYAKRAWNPNRAWSSSQMKEFHGRLIENAVQVTRLFRSVAARGTSVTLPVPARETVLTDGKPHRATVALERMKLEARHSVVPALSLATYVTGSAVNSSRFPLLPGDASVYLGGDLIGTSTVGFVAPGETAELYLGVDETVKVSRKLDSRMSSVHSWGKRRRIEAAYTVTVESFRKAPVAVAVEEALPVSENAAVSVRLKRPEPEPASAERGLTRWDLTVEGGGKASVSFGYAIEYPAEMAQVVEAAPAVQREMMTIQEAKAAK